MVQPHPVVSAPAGAGGHASVATYIRVAIVLAIVTAIEIGALYVPGVPTSALVTLLIVFSVAKFGLVVAFFMHLRYDARLFAFLFVGPLAIASAIILALMALFGAYLLLPRH
jgi:cytochrome c oxidase subunit 4